MKSPLSQFVNRAVDNEGNISTHTLATITSMRMPTQPFSPPPNPNNPRGEIHEKPISNLENSKFAAVSCEFGVFQIAYGFHRGPEVLP